jgi:hypothetical protein
MSITYTGAVPWVLMSQSWRTEKEHAESCCTKLTSASWLRPVCGGFHNIIRFNCAPFFASCRRHRVLTVTCLDACRCAAYLTLQSWRRVSLKRRLTFTGLHGVISQKINLFIAIVVRTSNPTIWIQVFPWFNSYKIPLTIYSGRKRLVQQLCT